MSDFATRVIPQYRALKLGPRRTYQRTKKDLINLATLVREAIALEVARQMPRGITVVYAPDHSEPVIAYEATEIFVTDERDDDGGWFIYAEARYGGEVLTTVDLRAIDLANYSGGFIETDTSYEYETCPRKLRRRLLNAGVEIVDNRL